MTAPRNIVLGLIAVVLAGIAILVKAIAMVVVFAVVAVASFWRAWRLRRSSHGAA